MANQIMISTVHTSTYAAIYQRTCNEVWLQICVHLAVDQVGTEAGYRDPASSMRVIKIGGEPRAIIISHRVNAVIRINHQRQYGKHE